MNLNRKLYGKKTNVKIKRRSKQPEKKLLRRRKKRSEHPRVRPPIAKPNASKWHHPAC
jgi:hypothetical protein